MMRSSVQAVFLAAAASLVATASGLMPGPRLAKPGSPTSKVAQLMPRQLPAEPKGVKTIITPNGFNITYKEPKICETTHGVKTYSGYVNLAPDVHSFFWFVESRNNPAKDPVTFWTNGGPGSDSMIAFFQEMGPCNVTENLTTELNPYAWNEVSNMFFLSQPVGVGFSYAKKGPGSVDPNWGEYLPASEAPVTGRYPFIDPTKIDTTDLAAIAAWEVMQGFYSALPQLDAQFGPGSSRVFNLATESYGGHYGPAFYNYFYQQNEKIRKGQMKNAVTLTFDTLTIINGIIDESVQAPYYPEFALHNTYGIPLYNQSIYDYTQIALYAPNGMGCLGQIEYCKEANRSAAYGKAVCAEAANMCRDNVEGAYYAFGDRGVYDIRHPRNDPTPPSYFVDYLNQASVQDALGVDLNYTVTNNADVYYAFQQTGDFVYPNFLEDLEEILSYGVRVSLMYGDADYICNWFGGEAISLAANFSHKAEFAAAGYAPVIVDGVEYGEVREYGNFSFTRVYESGHEIPYYQPAAALAMFNRTIHHLDMATGLKKITANLGTTGNAKATHTESSVALPTATAAGSSNAKGWGRVRPII